MSMSLTEFGHRTIKYYEQFADDKILPKDNTPRRTRRRKYVAGLVAVGQPRPD